VLIKISINYLAGRGTDPEGKFTDPAERFGSATLIIMKQQKNHDLLV
jgi:hypothetical protein